MRSALVGLLLGVTLLAANGCGRAAERGAETQSDGGAAPLALRGRVVDAGGAAVTGLTVTAVREQPGARRISYGNTDEAGHFELSPLDPGPLRVRIAFGADVALETDVVVVAEAPLADLVLVLPQGGLAGAVRDSALQPVPQLGVMVTGPGARLIRYQATDEAGAFRFEGLPDGDYTVAVDISALGALARRRIAVREGRMVEGLVFAPGALRLCGRVIDHEGDPIERAAILMRPLHDELRASGVRGSAVSDADGRFCASNLYAAAYEVTVDAQEHGRLRLDRVALEDSREDLSIVLGGGGELMGRVVDAGGTFATGVLVQAVQPMEGEVASARGVSDAEGRFRLQRVRPGSYHLFARGEGGLAPWSTVEVQPSARPLDYTLALSSKGSTLAGAVTVNGAPAPRIAVLLEHQWGLDLPVMVATDQMGHYAFSGLPGGTYRLRAVADGEWRERDVPVGDEAVVTADLAVGEAGGTP